MEELERANLFIVPLDDERHWYRYHHLFAQVLRGRLVSGTSPNLLARLHRRASSWFEQQGLIVEAVQHALAGHDWERAAGLLEAYGRWLMVRGQVHAVLGWLTALPEEVVCARPPLLINHATALICVNQLEAAEDRLQAAEEVLAAHRPDERSRTILGYATVLRASIARYRGDHIRCLSLSRQTLEVLPATDVPVRTSTNVNIAWACLMSGDVAPANERLLMGAVATAHKLGELLTYIRGMIMLADLQRGQGRLSQAAATYREAARAVLEPEMLRVLPNAAAYYFGLGDLLREWNDLDRAADLLAQGQEMVRAMLLVEADTILAGYIALAWLHQSHGDSATALATLREVEALARAASRPIYARVQWQLARTWR